MTLNESPRDHDETSGTEQRHRLGEMRREARRLSDDKRFDELAELCVVMQIEALRVGENGLASEARLSERLARNGMRRCRCVRNTGACAKCNG